MYYRDVAFWGRGAFTKERRYLPQFLGGGFSKLYQVTSQTQLSRPITLGHYTSWSADSAGNNKVCDVKAAADKLLWKHFCIDTHFSWVPRRLGLNLCRLFVLFSPLDEC